MLTTVDNFFGYTAYSPGEEIRLAFHRTYAEKSSHFTSLKGRAVCVVKLFTHTLNIGLKPLFYLACKIMLKAIPIFLSGLSSDSLRELAQIQDEDSQKDMLAALAGNPQLMQSLDTLSPLCILAAPISQLIKASQAALGIIHPGFYFREDELRPYFKELEEEAQAIGCSSKLIEGLSQGNQLIHRQLRHSSNREYFYAQLLRDIAVICEKFRDPAFPAMRKRVLLEMLTPDSDGVGIDSCTAGFGRIVQQICASLDTPEDPQKVIPWLADQYKGEVINRMILEATATQLQENAVEWHSTIVQLAIDPAHRGNGLIAAIGERIGLSPGMIALARCDAGASNQADALSLEKVNGLLQAFQTRYAAGLMESLKEQINSKEDGSPGLKAVRDHMIAGLAHKIAEDQPLIDDPAMYAVESYYLHGGRGSPSDSEFTDFNEQGIRAFADTLGVDNPFANFI